MSQANAHEGLYVHELSVELDGSRQLEDISFSLPVGARCAIIGQNGSGKSTLLRSLAGIISTRDGQLTYKNEKLNVPPNRQRAQWCIYAEQALSNPIHLSVEELILLGAWPYDSSDMLEVDLQSALTQTLVDFELIDMKYRVVSSLSGGEARRVHIARARFQQLINRSSSLMLIDEPDAHLDIRFAHLIMHIFSERADASTTLIAIHDLKLVPKYFDHVLLLKSGHIVDFGAIEHAYTPENISNCFDIPIDLLSNWLF